MRPSAALYEFQAGNQTAETPPHPPVRSAPGARSRAGRWGGAAGLRPGPAPPPPPGRFPPGPPHRTQLSPLKAPSRGRAGRASERRADGVLTQNTPQTLWGEGGLPTRREARGSRVVPPLADLGAGTEALESACVHTPSWGRTRAWGWRPQAGNKTGGRRAIPGRAGPAGRQDGPEGEPASGGRGAGEARGTGLCVPVCPAPRPVSLRLSGPTRPSASLQGPPPPFPGVPSAPREPSRRGAPGTQPGRR